VGSERTSLDTCLALRYDTIIMFEQLNLFARPSFSRPYTVSQLTGYIRSLIEEEPELSDLWVEGEVSNFTRASSGHCYFTLKDAGHAQGRRRPDRLRDVAQHRSGAGLPAGRR